MLNLLKYSIIIVFTFSGLIGCSKPQNASTEYSRSQINSAQETIIATRNGILTQTDVSQTTQRTNTTTSQREEEER